MSTRSSTPSDRLRALDATFLTIEREGAHMHVGGVLRFGGEPVKYDELVAAIERRLHLVPRYRQRLAFVPLGFSHPVWIDDDAFDVRRHVRHVAVPSPGSEHDLATVAARIFSQPLDRKLPLWELWLVDGCAAGGSTLVSKLHHCLVDGLASVNIATILFDATREPPDAGLPPEPWCARPAPAKSRLLLDAVADQLASVPSLVTQSLGDARGPSAFGQSALRASTGLGEFVASGMRRAPESIYNPPTGGQRRIAWVTVDLREVKAIGTQLGGTVNDVALTAVAGALRSHMRRRGERVDRVTLKTMVPVNVRDPSERDAMGNRITTLWAPLPVGVADPRRRFRLVRAAMQRLKRSNQVAGAKALAAVLDAVPPLLTRPVATMLANPRFFNLTVTNVPGPPESLYLLGRRLEEIVPIVPLAGGHALGIAMLSYCDALTFGLLADDVGMQDVDDLTADIREELEVLASLAPIGARRADDRDVVVAGVPVRRERTKAAEGSAMLVR